MATLEHEHTLVGPAAARPADPHVFVSATGRRARLLRTVGIGAGVAALAWLAALAFALLGVGRLPGLIPGTKTLRPDPAAVRTPRAHAAVASPQREMPAAAQALRARRAMATTPPARTALATPPARTAVATTPRATGRVPTKAAAAPATVLVTPMAPATAPTKGWAKRGWTTPPGQVTPARQTPRGNGNGRDGAPGQSTTPPSASASHALTKG